VILSIRILRNADCIIVREREATSAALFASRTASLSDGGHGGFVRWRRRKGRECEIPIAEGEMGEKGQKLGVKKEEKKK